MKALLDKLSSGRWILTILGGLTFTYLACKKILPNEATIGLLTLIFNSYFLRSDRKKEEENGKV